MTPWAYGYVAEGLTADRVRFTARLLDIDFLDLSLRDDLTCITFTYEVLSPATVAGQVMKQEWCKCPPATGDECLSEFSFFDKVGKMAVAFGCRDDTCRLQDYIGKEFYGTMHENGEIET